MLLQVAKTTINAVGKTVGNVRKQPVINRGKLIVLFEPTIMQSFSADQNYNSIEHSRKVSEAHFERQKH